MTGMVECLCVERALQDVPYLCDPHVSPGMPRSEQRRASCVLCGHDWDPWHAPVIQRHHRHRRVPAEVAAAFRLGGLPAVNALMHEVLHSHPDEWWIALEVRL